MSVGTEETQKIPIVGLADYKPGPVFTVEDIAKQAARLYHSWDAKNGVIKKNLTDYLHGIEVSRSDIGNILVFGDVKESLFQGGLDEWISKRYTDVDIKTWSKTPAYREVRLMLEANSYNLASCIDPFDTIAEEKFNTYIELIVNNIRQTDSTDEVVLAYRNFMHSRDLASSMLTYPQGEDVAGRVRNMGLGSDKGKSFIIISAVAGSQYIHAVKKRIKRYRAERETEQTAKK